MNKIFQYLRQHTTILLSIAFFLIPIILVERNVISFTNGIISYPVDDAFIHLAIGKNLAFYQTWGINPHEFASAASSLLYPVLIAICLKFFGSHLIIPLLLNVLSGIGLLVAMENWLKRQQIMPLARLIVLSAVILLTPLPVLAMCGMEHTMQLFFCFLFVFNFSDALAVMIRTNPKEWKLPWQVYLYGALLIATRYEGMYIIAIAALILVILKRAFLGFQLGMYTLLPIILFGLFSIYKGSYFFPNSVLLKSNMPPFTVVGIINFLTDSLPYRVSNSISGYNTISLQRLLFILPLAYILFVKQIRQVISYRYTLIILSAAVLLQLSFTGFPQFPRYEAYLIGCSVCIVGALCVKNWKELLIASNFYTRSIAAFIVFFLIFPLVIRSRDSFQDISQACINIYEQQYQMGQFLHDHYNTTAVAIGDIGAVSYYTVGRKFDLVGLGNLDIARSKRQHYYGAQFLDWLSKRDSVKVAVLYDIYTDPGLLQHWSKAATWEIPNNVTCGDNTVSFYAVDPNAREQLVKNLRDYQALLPKDVVVEYY